MTHIRLAICALICLGSGHVAVALVAPPDSPLVQRVELLPSDAGRLDRFGLAVAIDEDVVVVSGDEEAGGVYVFERNRSGPNRWGEAAKLIPPDGAPFDYFGLRIALDQTTIAAGSAGEYSDGAVYVYEIDENDSGSWELVTKLTAPDWRPGEGPGFFVVGVSNDTLVVGAPRESSPDSAPS